MLPPHSHLHLGLSDKNLEIFFNVIRNLKIKNQNEKLYNDSLLNKFRKYIKDKNKTILELWNNLLGPKEDIFA